jgi:uncharacterized protein (TIGR03437 family)
MLIPVTFMVEDGPAVQANPQSLSFGYQALSPSAPPDQQLIVTTSNRSPTAVTTTASTSSGGPWLTVQTSGSTPGTLQVSVNPSGLVAGSYGGTITITASGFQPDTVPVTLTVTAAPVLNALPAALTFAYQEGGSNPIAQTVSVTSSPTGIPFSVSVNDPWIHAVGGGTTDGPISVSVEPTGLAAGSYRGSVSVTSSQAGNSPVVVQVDLTITAAAIVTASPASLHFAYTQLGTVPAPQPVSITCTKPIGFTTSVSPNTPWLSATAGGTTPSIVTVTVNPTGLAAGDYSGSVLVDAPGAANTPLTIPVTITVAAAPLLQANPSQLTFGYQLGGPPSAAQPLTVTSSGAPVTVAASTSGEPWLSVVGAGGTTPAVFTVTADGSQLVAGTYHGTVIVTSSGAANSPLRVPVTLIVSAQAVLKADPEQLGFSHQIGQPSPPNQQIVVTSSAGPLTFSVAASTDSGGSWLIATGGGSTPSTVNVVVSPNGMEVGTYTGKVALGASGAGNSPLNIPVTLVVADAITLNASPASLRFSYQQGGSVPASQQIQVTSSGVQVPFSASIAAGATWLSVSGNSVTPGTITVDVNPAGLAPGDYAGTVVVLSAAAANNPLEVPVSLQVAAAGSLSVTPKILRFSYLSRGSLSASQTLNVTSTGSPLEFQAAVSSGTTWLHVSGGGTTPGTLQVSVDPTGLMVGVYNGTVLVSSTTVNSFEVVAVTLTVSTLPNLSASPASMNFSYQVKGSPPASQTLLVTSDSGSPFVTASASTFSGGAWLSAAGSGNTPFDVVVSVNPAGLAAGVYSGQLLLTSSGAGNSPYSILVTFTVSASPVLSAEPTSLTFAFTLGSPTAPPSQQLKITADSPTPVSVLASTSNGVPWLSATYAGSSTPLSITVSVNPAGLSSGNHLGTISVSSPVAGNSPLLIPVTFSMSAQPVLSALPSSASFVYTPGGPVPTPLPIIIDSTSKVSVQASVSPPTQWLTVSGGGATPATLQLAVNPVGLAPGSYTSAVLVTSQGAANSPLSIPVSLTVVSLPSLAASPSALYFTAEGQESVSAPLKVISTGVAQVPFIASASPNTPWLTVSGAGETPGTVAVQASAVGLTPGVYSGAVVITSTTAFNAPLLVPVTLNVAGAPVIAVSPPAITFSSMSGGRAQAQTVTVTLNAAPATNSQPLQLQPSPWMTVQAYAGGTFTVTADPSAVAPGEYLAGVAVIEPNASNSPVVVPVKLSVAGIPVQISPSSIALAAATGSSTATSDVIHLQGGPADFTVDVTGSTWLNVSPTAGSIPADLAITADPTSLTPGSYPGSVIIHITGAADDTIEVVLAVGAPTALVVSPLHLTYRYRQGDSIPASQSIAVSSAATGLGFQVAGADSWVSVDTAFATSPARFGATVNPSGLAPGLYHSEITLTNPPGNAAPHIPVELYVDQPSAPRISTINNGASFFFPAALAPGLIFSIFGRGLGPGTPVIPAFSGGYLPILMGGARVLVNGVPCPLLYVSESQINAVASFAVDGVTDAMVVVQYLGVRSDPVELTPAASAPGIFSQNWTGRGAGTILNLDNSVNSPANPADRGSFVAMFAAGGGQTTPPGVDGSIYTEAGWRPQLPVQVQVGGVDAEVCYAGAAPGFVAGTLQVNFRIPANVPAGENFVVLKIGNAVSQPGLTVSIR